jgi:hypothetical protein
MNERMAAIGFVVLAAVSCVATHRKPPYLRRVGDRGGLTIWVVDGTFIRNTMNIEFTNFGQHYVFDFIPPTELWLDEENQPDEQPFFVEHLIAERGAMARGASYDSAVDIGDRVEILERRAAGDLARVNDAKGVADPSKTHISLWMTTAPGVAVWIVNGRLVRSAFDIEFTEGGHDRVYDYVPAGEVWIDNDLSPSERPYVLLHELHERTLMIAGATYESAHAAADTVELYARKHPSELGRELEREKRP